MRLDRFTSKFQVAISDAQSLALGRDHQYIEPVHLMVALLNQEGSSIRPLLTMLNVDVVHLRSKLAELLDKLPKVTGVGGDVQLSSSMGQVFNLCDKSLRSAKMRISHLKSSYLLRLKTKAPWGSCLKSKG
ncbi:ClpB protein [Vibrio maritimus]|uniref:ClpB protein n=1 Tax=Vibrio maritimus TaxID=990268 RepID=A0A090S1Y5_9VIBR|nr:ClpB protein [Vibrio maritimus]